jgi:uncharacterized membrane protein YfcA
MEFIIISAAALTASTLTLFSGFGLGTLLMPVVAIFFPVEVAIAMTAMVHLANNLFKVVLMGKHANREILLSFGLPAVASAFAGALVLDALSGMSPLLEYSLFDRQMQIFPVKLIIGLLILGFICLEFSSWFSAIALDRKYLPFGGVISGFFGGLSGHQGAFRSMFLLKAGLDKNTFVATGVMLAVMVDMSRMVIYGWNTASRHQEVNWTLVAAATVSAFTGAYFGKKILHKLTLKSVQIVVSLLLIIISLGLITGAL